MEPWLLPEWGSDREAVVSCGECLLAAAVFFLLALALRHGADVLPRHPWFPAVQAPALRRAGAYGFEVSVMAFVGGGIACAAFALQQLLYTLFSRLNRAG